MLNSLSIQNYRNLKDLSIKSLGKLNLITGKNNTGKSSVLEAVALYAAKGELHRLAELFIARGFDVRINNEQSIIRALNSMFSEGDSGLRQDCQISVGPISTPENLQTISDNTVGVRFVRYKEESIGAGYQRTILEPDSDYETPSTGIALQIKTNAVFGFLIAGVELANIFTPIRYKKAVPKGNKLQFIPSGNIDRGINGELWDEIALTEKEQFVIDALKIIEPATERIAFIGPSGRAGERDAVVKLSGKAAVLPLRGMGDGINRILTIILALVSAEKGFLLIDEFENGLHYSTQEQLWKIIAFLSEKLDVQVFATTHSDDCIRAFEHTINTPGNTLNGKLIRLDNINGNIRQVEFDARELQISTENDIEIR